MFADESATEAQTRPRRGPRRRLRIRRRAGPLRPALHPGGGRLRAAAAGAHPPGRALERSIGDLTREGSCELQVGGDRGAGALRPRRPRRRDPAARAARPGARRGVDALGRDRGRKPGLLRRRRGASAPQPRLATDRDASLRQRLGDDEPRGRRSDRGTRGDQLGFRLGGEPARPRGAGAARAARDRQAWRMGRHPSRGRLQAARRTRPGHGQGRRRPSHGDREPLHRGRGAGDRARDLPLSPQRQRLERHRLQRARRPVRQPLRGAGRRGEEGRRRRPRPGLQLPDHRRGVDRHPHLDRGLAGGKGVAGRLPGVEAHRARPARYRQDDPDLGRRRSQPLPARPQGAAEQDHRPPHGRAHGLSRGAPRTPRSRGCGGWSSSGSRREAGRWCRRKTRSHRSAGTRPEPGSRSGVRGRGRRGRSRPRRDRRRGARTRPDRRPARGCGTRAHGWRSRA